MCKILIVFLMIFLSKIFLEYKILNYKVNIKNIFYNLIQLIGSLSFIYLINNYPTILNLSFIDSIMIILGFLIFLMFIFHYNIIKLKIKRSIYYKYGFISILFLFISIFIEIFICNFRFFQTFFYKPINVSMEKVLTNKNISTEQEFYIEISNINKKLKNVFIDISYDSSYFARIDATDSGSSEYFSLPSREISNKIPKSKYFSLNLSGESSKIKLNFSFHNKENFSINQIVFNSPIPLYFSSIRCIMILLILEFIYLFKSKSFIFKKKLLEFKHKKILISFIIMIHVVSFSLLGYKAILEFKSPNYDLYNKLVDSLKKGKTYLVDENNSEELLNTMDNPYESLLREKLFAEKGKKFLWDTAFYKGKYYVYFGVAPVVLFYLPYNIVFNNYLSTSFIVYLCVIFTVIFICLLLYQFIKKFYSNCSIGIFVLLSLLLVYCTGLEYLIKTANVYALPIASALMFTMLGLNLWMGILKSKRLIKTKMFFGSLSLAIVAGCRPQLLLGSILIIPILISFYKEHKNKIQKKDYLKYILSIMIPYLIVAIPLMYYNYVRFASPFDFGANYNLTTNDMTVRGFRWGRIPLGLMMYLFNPMNFKNVFPFIVENTLSTNYLGLTIYENIYGGLLFTTLIYGVCLFLPKFKKVINNNLIYYTCVTMILSALIIVIVDTQMAGILARYLSDFTWLFGFVTSIIILAIENKSFKRKDIFHKIVVILISLALIYQFFYFFCSILDQFKLSHLDFWLYFYYLVQFWI